MKKIKKNGKREPIQKTRKQLRKEKRQQKKINRAQYYALKKKNSGKFVKNSDQPKPEKNNNNVIKNVMKNNNDSKRVKKNTVVKDKLRKQVEQENSQLKKLKKQMNNNRKIGLIKDNEREDKIIKTLEKQLKLNKRKGKNVPKSFTEDGLDYLLDFCNDENRKLAVETEKQLLGVDDDEDDFEEDFQMMTGKISQNNEKIKINKKTEKNKNNGEDVDDIDGDDDDEDDNDDIDNDDDDEDNLDEDDINMDEEESDEFNDEEEDETDDIDTDDDEDEDEDFNKEKNKSHKKKENKTIQDKSTNKNNSKVTNKNKTKTKSNVSVNINDDDSEASSDDVDMSGDDENMFEDDVSMSDNELNKDSDDNTTPHNTNSNKVAKKGKEREGEAESGSENDQVWEDIYGRKRDRDGNILPNNTGKYIPPAARLKQLEKNPAEQEKLSRLRKQLKGLINRLAEFNMHTIASQIEDLYMSNSRNDMNELLSGLMIESLISPVITPDRLVSEHMLLIAVLHANVGTEVGAHFLLTLVKKFDEMMKQHQNVENKELDNLILMLSHLYNFKVYGCQLVYQILEKLTDKFTEKEIELILLILKTVGFVLRKDDPAALKELILNLQQKAKLSESSNARIQFMLDILLAIKNNNMSKIPQYDPTHVEHLKKISKGFLRKGNSITQFNISLSDLLKANERGKWWIVGSAWTGTIDSAKNNSNTKNPESNQVQYSEKLLELARKQRMNTDTRRNIFCILMTAEDYLDAFEKIHHLSLKGQQEREVISVIIKCCLQEKRFNPYYAVLAQKFCDSDRKHQMTLQCALWDKLKTLDSCNNTQINNLSKFLTHLFIEKGLPLSALKVIEFGELDKPTMRLIRQIMLGILLHENEEACLQVFERISMSPNLQTLREGLRLFISHFLVKNADSKSLPDKELNKLKERGEMVDKILYNRSVKIY